MPLTVRLDAKSRRMLDSLAKRSRMSRSDVVRYDKEAHQAFARMLVREAATHRVLIGGTAFEGRIETFYGEGTFYRSFLAEGLAECERTPAIER